MKARVKATGEIVEIINIDFDTIFCNNGGHYTLEHLEGVEYDLNYWTKLEHTYVGMVMQGLCINSEWNDSTWDIMAEDAISAAHILVEKLKEKEE